MLLRENTYLWLNPGLTICISQASDQYACLPEGEPKYFCNFILHSKSITLGIFVSPYLLGCSDSPGTRISSSLFYCTTANWVLPGKWNKTHRKYKYFYPALCSWVWWSQVQVIFLSHMSNTRGNHRSAEQVRMMTIKGSVSAILTHILGSEVGEVLLR